MKNYKKVMPYGNFYLISLLCSVKISLLCYELFTRRRCNKWEDHVKYVVKEKSLAILSAMLTIIIEELGQLI